MWNMRELQKIGRESIVSLEVKKSAFVAHLIAIIRRAENRHKSVTMLPLKPLVANLVRSHNQVQTIRFQKIVRHVRSKRQTDSAL